MNEWKTVRLGDVCEILNGYAFKSDKYVDSGIRVIRITNVQKGFIEDNSPAFYSITEKENLKDYELHENDLLISLTGNVGRVALLSKEMLPAALNQRVGCIRIKDKNLLISYLFTFLNSDKFEYDCIYSARGIAQKNMSTEWLKNYIIPLPPIEVQKKIANNLNTCTKIIKKHNKQLNNFDLLIKSRFIEMFGDPVQNPMGWEEKRFKDICDLITDGEHNTPNRSSKGIYLLSARNIHNHILKLEDVDYIDEEEYARISKRIIPQEGDVLISCSGSVGRVCSVPKNFKFQMVRSVALLRLKEIVTPLFMEYLIESDYLQNQIDKAKTQSSQANLFQGKIAELKGFVPPLELQNDFATFVQQIDKSKFAVQKSLEKAETLYKSLMQEYFG